MASLSVSHEVNVWDTSIPLSVKVVSCAIRVTGISIPIFAMDAASIFVTIPAINLAD